jgi:WD40 repeat protein
MIRPTLLIALVLTADLGAALASPASPHADVTTLTAKTSAGGDVIGIGQPRMQLVEPEAVSQPLAIRVRAGLIASKDARAVTLWSLATGEVLQRIEPPADDHTTFSSFAMAANADWLAIGGEKGTRVFAPPFAQVAFTLKCLHVLAFSQDSKLLACQSLYPEIWDVAQQKLIAKLPDRDLKSDPLRAQFSSDNRSLYWMSDRDIVRWDFAGDGAATTIYQMREHHPGAALSDASPTAIVSFHTSELLKHDTSLIDLATGKVIASSQQRWDAVSPSGQRIAYSNGSEVRIIEAKTGKSVFTIPTDTLVSNVSFASDAGVIGFVDEHHQIHIVDVATGPRVYDPPSRFAGWLADGVAAIERQGQRAQLTLADRSWQAQLAVASPAPSNAPEWASWRTEDGSVAAEPYPRRDSAPEWRANTPCPAGLRVWTAKGGERLLTLVCGLDEAGDPGWEIGGGWAVGITTTTATVYAAATGKRAGVVAVDRPWLDKPEFARAFWLGALSPAGNALAMISRGTELPPEGTPDPREDALHNFTMRESTACEHDWSGFCRTAFIVTLYKLGRAPAKVWQVRLDAPLTGNGELPKPTAIAFDHAGKHLLVGTSDGLIQIWSTTKPGASRVERFHHGPITQLTVSPGDGWVFSEDAAGQQRLWRMPAP